MSQANWDLEQGNLSRRIRNSFSAVPANPTKGTLQARLTSLERNWTRFENQHLEYLNKAASLTTPLINFTEEVYASTEEAFLDNKGKFLDALNALPSEIAPQPIVNPTFTYKNLPKLDIPKFSGNYTDWPNFKDLFTALVHSTEIPAVEKLSHLKALVIGEAGTLLKNIPVSAENYTRAWDLLDNRFSNKRLLVSSYLSTLTSLKLIKAESASELNHLYNNTIDCVEALKALNRPVDNWSDWLVHITVEKFDKQTRREWESAIGSSMDPPTFNRLKEFMQIQIRTLEAFQGPSQTPPGKDSKSNSSNQSKGSSKSQAKGQKSVHIATEKQSNQGSRNCFFCNQEHYLMYCQSFKDKDVQQRLQFVSQKNLCTNCFGLHPLADCRSKNTCRECHGNHHTLLHSGAQGQISRASFSQPSTSASVNTVSLQTVAPNTNSVVLATAKVRIRTNSGDFIQVRALVDPCSEVTLISESLSQTLQLKRSPKKIILVGVMERRAGSSRGSVNVTISPWFDSEFELTFNALVLPRLSSYSPKLSRCDGRWPDLSDITLADPDFADFQPVDLLLGVDLYRILILEGLRKGDSSTPVAQSTQLGWILSGPTSCESQDPTERGDKTTSIVTCQHLTTDSGTLFDLQKFWIDQEINPSKDLLSSEDRTCEEHFAATHSRSPDGVYTVRLPFKEEVSNLGNSFTPALRMLQSMERRFSKNLKLQSNYTDFLEEYERLNHMSRLSVVPSSEDSGFFLPHHGVLRENSLTTKLRVVFNGSQRTTQGLSLNSLLHSGPRLQPNLADIILRWRLHAVVFSADIEKMFRQIRVHPDDHKWQRILWRTTPGEPLIAFQLSTVTYGLASSPYLALRTIKQLAHDEEHRFPSASICLKKDIYVDDVFAGADSIPAASNLQKELRELCTAGGFPLRKFSSNSLELLNQIPEELHATTIEISWETGFSTSVLGLKWQPKEDIFIFPVQISPLPEVLTRRNVLSQIAQLFDPIGLLSPVIITAKIFIQSLWLLNLDWDDPLPDVESQTWTSFYSGLQSLSTLQIPRWLNFYQSTGSYELHGFSDASDLAYSAVVYLRSRLEDGTVTMTIITSKTRVAPLQKQSIPRLELNGAVLLSRLVNQVTLTLQIKVPIYLWTDSTVVLAWIQKQPSTWPTYVANRVSEIQTLTPEVTWAHISTKDNPADCASRGLAPQELASFSLWWVSPRFLNDPITWPTRNQPSHFETDLELRQAEATVLTVQIDYWELIQRYSCLSKLLRVTARCLRFISLLLHRPCVSSTPVIASELLLAREVLIRHDQFFFFRNEIRAVQQKKSLPSKSPLLRFTLKLDEKGLLRLGGRLRNAFLDEDEKYPLILDSSSPLTTLLIRECHFRCLHGGVQLTLSTLRQNYWILNGRRAVKTVIHRCVTCTRFRASSLHQLMGDLPVRRVTPSRPFLHSGIDYAGPIQLRCSKGRGQKTYKGFIALFICFSTRAVHLEVVEDYSSSEFLKAYRRFISRRGIPSSISSDQGTTFVGADSQLRAMFTSASNEFTDIEAGLASIGTTWRFNPPSAPHFGGLWEAGVKSMKFHMKRVLRETNLTFADMSTFLCQVEACLNSRPLQAMSDDPDDFSALTPGHFLIGTALNAVPEPSCVDLPINRLSNWQQLQRLRDHFWERWSSEYLKTFQARSKWTRATSSLQEGDLVIIRQDNIPPSRWLLGRVLRLHPGADKLVRVVSLKTQNGQIDRPIVKLCKLPVSSASDCP